MHSKLGSIKKRWHSLLVSPAACKTKWAGEYWREDVDGHRVVACRNCPSFEAGKLQCSVGFGSPLRKCVVSSIEAHLHDCKDQQVLEVGFGRFMLARNLIRRSGGTWSGVEPQRPKSEKAMLGKGGYGTATDIPFPDQTFDKVFGVQSIEHWGQLVGGREPSKYSQCLAEICRVLKPGGGIYFDAPIHFHGHEMFIMGDLKKIEAQFDDALWKNVKIEKWRQDYEPLERYEPTEAVLTNDWPVDIVSYPEAMVTEARENNIVWMIAITADKR